MITQRRGIEARPRSRTNSGDFLAHGDEGKSCLTEITCHHTQHQYTFFELRPDSLHIDMHCGGPRWSAWRSTSSAYHLSFPVCAIHMFLISQDIRFQLYGFSTFQSKGEFRRNRSNQLVYCPLKVILQPAGDCTVSSSLIFYSHVRLTSLLQDPQSRVGKNVTGNPIDIVHRRQGHWRELVRQCDADSVWILMLSTPRESVCL